MGLPGLNQYLLKDTTHSASGEVRNRNPSISNQALSHHPSHLPLLLTMKSIKVYNTWK